MGDLWLVALIILAGTIGAILWGRVDRSAVAVFGVLLMILLGVMTEYEAFTFVDWNVIVLLVSIWIIAGYFGKSGFPEYLASKAIKWSKGSMSTFILLMGSMAAVVSLFVDNILVILLFAPIALHITRLLNLNPAPYLIFIGLCANFSGSALLIGDLPPQMLHSVSGIEFLGFIWHSGRPSSFPILMTTFAVILLIFRARFKRLFKKNGSALEVFPLLEEGRAGLKDKRAAVIILIFFVGTIVALALRQAIGLQLGVIALIGAVLLVLCLEALGDRVQKPSFSDVLGTLDWRAILFYVALFALIGGIEKQGIIEAAAAAVAPLLTSSEPLGVSALYWMTVPIVGILEHDAYILAFFYMIRDLALQTGLDPWPYWWAILWAGTLGSNLTVAGAPALLVSLNICEKECYRVSLKEFLSYSIPFVLISVTVCFLLLMVFWVLF